MDSKRRENVSGSIAENRTEVRYNAKDIVRFLIPRILFGLCGFFVGQAVLPFGAKPFGVALLSAAVGYCVLPIYLGLSISAFVTMEAVEAFAYFGIYTALLLVRVLINITRRVNDTSFEKRVSLKSLFEGAFYGKLGVRILVSATFALLLGSVILLLGGVLYYDLFALFVLMGIAPIITALLCGFFEIEERREGELRSFWRDIGFLVLASVATFGARESVIFGVSVAVFGIFIATFLVSYLRGVGYGAILGLILGLCYSPMLSPMFVLAAVSAGIFIRFSSALACFCAFVASSAWAFYVEGLSALLGIFGGILSACLLYSVLHKIIFVDFSEKQVSAKSEEKSDCKKRSVKTECTVLPDSALDGIKLYEMNSKMSAVSDGLRKLSDFFEEIKSRDRELENGFENCDEKYNFQPLVDDLTSDYGTLSSLLTKTMEQSEDDYKIDIELSRRLCFTLTELNLAIQGVIVFGVRKKTIYIRGKNKNKLEENAINIMESIAPLLPFSLDVPTFDIRREGDGSQGSLLLFEKQKISTSVVRRRVMAKDENVYGDSIAIFKNRDDRFFSVLSDGMGSGEAASVVSQICTGFVSNMLSIGNMNTELISMLNSYICARPVGAKLECSATLDMLEVDLMSGRADIYKCGAAPSYVFRKGKLFKIRSKTMPIGILKEVDVKHFSFDLCVGDVVVMVSDGVVGESGECPWLFDLLTKNLPCRTLERTAELIVKYSSARGSVDDISVILIEIK